ncbi:glucosamine-6-phosphate deaminase [Lederbergia panacisoli]|uniref:glucosamine-6-phosphate deaminase n=1 Tax=Lederbergia panacisoli TaxID=1255251 RepID=UPI00214C6560|nr:glucosamine-6-phosphate deaminase [Lederbergia panacisoli]MCR2822979.1 glucosamine-6-phosphate deaminase [Lederbergia panacisoli]
MIIHMKTLPAEVDRFAALFVSRMVITKPDLVLGLATGNTTEGLHRELVQLHLNAGIDYSKVSTFNLDEYIGLAPDDPTSCRARINQDLLKQININMKNTFVPDGLADSPEKECEDYEKKITQLGGIDLQILSIGENGHIAFNEPGTPFGTMMRIAEISASTVKAKTELFGSADNVPAQGITMGIRNIMHAKQILLIAKGKHKADIMQQALFGPVTERVPASVLQLHPYLTVVVDADAGSNFDIKQIQI